jgi:hypothetical protein
MNLQELRGALQPLKNFGTEELTFDVEDTTVSMRPLLPQEEVAAQQYAAALLEDDEDADDDRVLSRASALRYFDQFRTEVIAYALVQVGDLQLRDITHIETGETLENGTPVRVAKHVALRELISAEWSRAMITICFSRYGDLVTKIAEKADKIAKSSLADLDAEIERVEKRLDDLKDERERRATGDPSVTTQQIRSLVAAGEALEQEVDQTIDMAREERRAADAIRRAAMEELENEDAEALADLEVGVPAEPEPEPEPERQSVVPPKASPPTKKVTPPSDVDTPPGFVSSFADPEEDPHALDADAARIMAAREQAAKAAREEIVDPIAQAEHVGNVKKDGKDIPTFKLPAADLGDTPVQKETETISGRGRGKKGKKGKQIPVDPDPRQGTLNPNYKPGGQ